MVNGICEEHVWCACHTLQLSIKNHIDPPKPKNAPAPINPTSELIATFRKLVNKIHSSPLLTENLRTAQSGGPAAEVIVEIPEDDVNEGSSQEGADDAATNHHNVHGSPCRHTLKLIQDVVTRRNTTYYMLSQCVQLKLPLCKLMNELGLEGPSDNDWVTGELLCDFMKPFQTVTDYLQGEKYPTLGSQSWKITQLLLYLSRPKPPQSWGLNKDWADLPIAVTCMRDFLLNDLTKRWDTGNVLLGMAFLLLQLHPSWCFCELS